MIDAERRREPGRRLDVGRVGLGGQREERDLELAQRDRDDAAVVTGGESDGGGRLQIPARE
jgi:hypothetical protein